MKDHDKTKEQLLQELTELRQAFLGPSGASQAEPRPSVDLRRKAEDRFRQQHAGRAGAMTDTDIRTLVQELQVHQIELEMQNEELATAQASAQDLSEKYSDLFDFAPIGYYLWDARGRLLEVNLSGAALLGMERSTAFNQRFGRFVATEDRPAFAEFCAAVLRTDVKQRCEVKLRIQDQAVYVLIEAITVRDHAGMNRRCRAVVIDVSERKRLQSAVALRERLLNSFFTGATVGLALLDKELRYLQVNQTLAAMNGIATEEHLGRTVREVIPERAAAVEAIVHSVLATRAPVLNVEVAGPMRNPSGFQRQWAESYFPIAGADGIPEGVGALVVEITDRKQAEETHHRLQQQSVHAARLSTMAEMLAGIAHELNQPLHSIATLAKACGNVLSQDKVGLEQLREWNAAIAVAAVRGGKIIKGLRALLGKSEPQCMPTPVREVIDESLALVGFELRERQVVVHTQVEAADVVVGIERVQIQQVLVNLLQNACEAFAEKSERARRVTIRVAAAGEFIDVSVADNGPGLQGCDVSKIFDPFFTTKSSGMGMGLAISRTIVEAHGGRTWAVAPPGGGVTFHFTLPVATEGLSGVR